MVYKIIVDRNPRNNPSSDKKEYVIDIEELRLKGNVYDCLIIKRSESYILRYLELTEYYILKERASPLVENLPNLNIELFKGDNYIYIQNMSNNLLSAEYIIKNDFTDTYVTDVQMHSAIEIGTENINIEIDQKLSEYSKTTEMNAAINLKAEEIESVVKKKVGENEIISKINQSSEAVSIQANKINLVGIVTANENFKILEDGSMQAKNGSFSGNIYLGNGSKVVGGEGLLTNFQYSSVGKYQGYDWLGFNAESNGQSLSYYKQDVSVEVDIPKNFIVVSAKLKLYHTPINWNYTDDSYNIKSVNGYSRNLKLYKAYSDDSNFNFNMMRFSEGKIDGSYLSLSEISNAFSATTYTPSNTSGNSITCKETVDITNYVKGEGKHKLVVRTNDAVPSDELTACSKTGMARIVVDVIGYIGY